MVTCMKDHPMWDLSQWGLAIEKATQICKKVGKEITWPVFYQNSGSRNPRIFGSALHFIYVWNGSYYQLLQDLRLIMHGPGTSGRKQIFLQFGYTIPDGIVGDVAFREFLIDLMDTTDLLV